MLLSVQLGMDKDEKEIKLLFQKKKLEIDENHTGIELIIGIISIEIDFNVKSLWDVLQLLCLMMMMI